MLSECERLIKFLIQSDCGLYPVAGDASVHRLYVDLSNPDIDPSTPIDETIYEEAGVERSEDTDAILRERWIIGYLNTDGFVGWEAYSTKEEYRAAWARCEAEVEGWDTI